MKRNINEWFFFSFIENPTLALLGASENVAFFTKKKREAKKKSFHRLVRSQDGRERWRESEGKEAEGKCQKNEQNLQPPGHPKYDQTLKPPGRPLYDQTLTPPGRPLYDQTLKPPDRVSKDVTSGQAYVCIGENLHPACPQGLALL
jgi:hypothetical protein